MLTRVIQFIIGAFLGGGGGYLLWSNRELAPNLFPPTTSGVPWLLVLSLLVTMAGAVFLVYAVHPRPERKARLAAQAARREETLTAADKYYGQRSRAADRDWRSGDLPLTQAPRPAPAPEPVRQVEPIRQPETEVIRKPSPQPVAKQTPEPVRPTAARPDAVRPAGSSTPVEPGQPTPFPSQATLAPIPKAAEAPPPTVQPKAGTLPPPPALAPAPPAAAQRPVTEAGPQPAAGPAPTSAPPPESAAPLGVVSPPVATPPAAVGPAATPTAPAGATVVKPNFTTLSLEPTEAPPASQPTQRPAAPILGAVKPSPAPAPAPVAPPEPAISAPIVLEKMPPLKTAEHSFDRIRTAIREGRLVEADKMLAAERETAQGVALAELTGLAGDQAAAAGRQSNAKWLWRLALKRFGEANAMDAPAARAVAESLRLADA